MTVRLPSPSQGAETPLPLDDPYLDQQIDLAALADHWAATAARTPMSAEAMRGADARAQRQGISGTDLMEQAGAAVAATARALLVATERRGHGRVLILAGPGNNGGDGFVAARHLAHAGIGSIVVMCAAQAHPDTADARLNWQRLGDEPLVQRQHAPGPREVALLQQHIERAALVVDALLGTGVQGVLREPIRSAVELVGLARAAGVPVLAVDTPTAVDLTTGRPSDPVVRADVTITFHRPKAGLQTRVGRALAGRVLVAPIGIPHAADPS